jgi:hypothetical protein
MTTDPDVQQTDAQKLLDVVKDIARHLISISESLETLSVTFQDCTFVGARSDKTIFRTYDMSRE